MGKSFLHILAFLILAGICACSTMRRTGSTGQQPKQPRSYFDASFKAVLPCAQCAGIATQLDFDDNGSYRLQREYLKSDRQQPYPIYGTYHRYGDSIILDEGTQQSQQPRFYVFEGKNLRQLDRRRLKIKGRQAAQYLFRPASIQPDASLSEQPSGKTGKTVLQQDTGSFHIWVASSRIDCEGSATQTCFLVQRAEEIDPNGDWELLYGEIRGFEYQPGMLYHLLIKEVARASTTSETDSRASTYQFVEQIEQKPDPNLALHDIWAFEAMGSMRKESWPSDLDRPVIELYPAEKRIVGSDGCNRFRGTIQRLAPGEISFNPLLSTKMACPEMEASGQFAQALARTASYELREGQLLFFDSSGKELLRFIKVN